MSSILAALGKVKDPASDSGHDGASTGSSSEGPPPGGPPQGQRAGRRSRWVAVVLVSGLGLALVVVAGRFLVDSQDAPAPAVEVTKVRPKTPPGPKASKVGAWPKVPHARPGLPPELTRHPGATKASPWPVASVAKPKPARPVAKLAMPAVVKPVAKPTAPAVVRPVPKAAAGGGLAGLVAAREKMLAEGDEEGLKNFGKAFPAVAAAAKRAKTVLESPPAGAPRVDILFLQWADERDERLASLRSQGGSLSIVYEGDVVDGMAVASIHADKILFTWRGVTFRQPVHRY